MDKIKKIVVWLVLIFVAVMAKVVFSEIGRAHAKSQIQQTQTSLPPVDRVNEILVKAASITNRNLPMMVDSETRLDSTVGAGYTFKYMYTLVNYEADSIDKNTFISEYKPLVTNGACTTESLIPFFKIGVNVVYSYYGKNRKFIADINVTPESCKNL